MKIIDTPLPGIVVVQPFIFEDERGSFVKTFHQDQLENVGISVSLKEEFYSTSAKDVLRGMHFQVPPHAHQKLIYCISGRVMDVLLDLRKDSPSYGKSVAIELSASNRYMVYVPVGFAHGFLSLENGSCLVYKTDAVHAAAFDKGVKWDSFGHDWGVRNAIISDRDQGHPDFTAFESPF